MHLSKVSLVAAALALSCGCDFFAPGAHAATAVWNGGKTGWSVVTIDGVPTVVDADGTPVSGSSGAGPAGGIGGSGIWDDATLNWNTAGMPAVKRVIDDALFDGTGGVVLVSSTANQGGALSFSSGGYTLVGERGVGVRYASVQLDAGTTTIYNLTGSAAITGKLGSTLVVNNSISTGVGPMIGKMNFVKDGAGELEYSGFYSEYYRLNQRAAVTGTSIRGFTYALDATGYHTLAEKPLLPIVNSTPPFYDDGISGSVTVNQGSLKVKGYLNSWYEIPEQIFDGLDWGDHMAGASEIVLNGSSELNFTNTAMATGKRHGPQLGGEDGPLTRRYNFANNIKAGLNHDQVRTRLFTGTDDTYRIVLHTDGKTARLVDLVTPRDPVVTDDERRKVVGSVGVLAGRGDVIKTGKGQLYILNDVEQGIGRFQISDGTVVLKSATGRDLALVSSVNLAGLDSRRGEGTESKFSDANSPEASAWWMPGVAPAPGLGQLVLSRDAAIQNLQADFAYASAGATVTAAVEKAVTEFGDEALIAGTGKGSNIFLGSSTLSINQTRDGVYAGNIYGAYTYDVATGKYAGVTGNPTRIGRIVKSGDATLALIGDIGEFSTVDIQGGKLIASAAMLGYGTFNLNAGNLVIFQNTAGNLNATLTGSADLRITTSAFVNNGSADPIQINSSGTAGYLRFVRSQTLFTGNIFAEEGVTLELSAAAPDALITANSVSLIGGTVGKETTLAVGNGVQHLRNLGGDAGSRLDLGRGVLFLNQSASGAFLGKISGVGTLVKDGGAQMTLDATKTTYFGATVVSGGSLAINAANGLSRSSGLILKSGGVFSAGGVNQTFGALFGESGTTVAMGAGNLTIGTTAERNQLLATEVSGGAPLSSNYLGTSVYADFGGPPRHIGQFDSAILPVAPVDFADATRSFLRDIIGVSNGATLDFAGSITGTGGLRKIGVETLFLSGVNTYSGATVVEAGTLRVNADAIDRTTGVTVATGALFSLNADAGVVKTFAPTVSGGGDLEKVGAGEVTLGADLQLSGGIAARAGALRLTLSGDRSAVVSIAGLAGGAHAADARLIFNQAGSVTLGGTLTGDGVLVKEGVGRLNVSSSTFTGDVEVRGGTLALAQLPTAGDITVASGAALEASTLAVPNYSGLLNGAGEVRFSGGVVTLSRVSTAFTGKLIMTGGELIAGTSDLYPSGIIGLRAGAGLDLAGSTQTLAGIEGSEDSYIRLSSGFLGVDVGVGKVSEFSGMMQGTGVIHKTGFGTFRLTGTADTGWTGTVQVDAGTLEARPSALSVASVSLATDGTLALFNDIVGAPLSYATAISGTGTIGKTGAGVITLENACAGFAGGVRITGGELRIASGSLGGRIFADVSFKAAGAGSGIYAVVLSGDTVLDTQSLTESVKGFGSVAVEGAHTFKLVNGQTYTGNTILRSGAKLDISDGSFGGTLNGLAGDQGTEVIVGGAALTIDQNVAGRFAGDFSAPVALTVTNTTGNGAKFTLDSASLASVGSLTLAGGHLVLASTDTAAVTLAGGTLYFDTTVASRVYAGAVSGTGTVVKTGSGDLTLTAADMPAFAGLTGKIGVDQGRLTVSAELLPAGINGLYSAGTGTLAFTVADGASTTFSPTRTITGTGDLSKIGGGTLLLGAAGNPYVIGSTGAFTVSQGTLGGRFTTSGDLVVASGGTLAPGNSPGLVTVNGDLTLSGVLAMELTDRNVVAGTDYDAVQVNGVATLGGTLRVTQFGAKSPVRGQAYTIINTTGGVTGDFTSIDTTAVAGVAGRQVIVVTPSRNVDSSATGYLYGLGSNTGVVIYVVDSLASTPGYTPHEGLSGLTAQLDNFVLGTSSTGIPANRLGARLATAAPGALDSMVNALSPLGYGALYAMDRETGLRQEEQIRSRLEQRRYDNAGERIDPWEAFVVGSGALAANDSASDTPTFDYNTVGGLVGLDKKLENGPVVGVAAGYDNGTATLHDGAGKITMSRVRGTAFLSTMVNRAWYLDATVSAGVADFEGKRNTLTGRNTGNTTGYDYGVSLTTGTIVALRTDLHLTPFVSASYSHHEFDGFTEKGSESRLAADSWSNDSVRVSAGTGLGWWVPVADMKLKLGVDVAYNHELLDTESEIGARFTQLGGSTFKTTAAALPQDSVSVGPNVTLNVDEVSSVSAGYIFEYGLDGRIYNAFNVAYRRRF